MQELSLVRIEEVVSALEAATTVQEVKNHIDAAKAAEVYAKQAKVGKELELKVFQYLKNAERKLGEMLAAAKAAGQITHAHDPRHKPKPVVPNENNRSFTLEEAGISRKLSSRAQKLAAIPREDFDKAVSEGKEPMNMVAKPAQFDGKKSNQIARILEAMKDGQWRTFKEIEELTGGDRRDTGRLLRFLKDPKFGSYIVELRSEGPENEYRVLDKQNYNGVEPKPDSRMPAISREMLSLTAQQKFDLAVKQEKHRLGIMFEQLVQERVNQRMKLLLETLTPKLKAEQEEAQRIIKARRGIMGPKTYKKILSCLHPDRALHPAYGNDEGLRKAYEESFYFFSRLKRLVLDEKACPTPVDDKSAPLPQTMAEWEEAERKATAARKAQYAARKANKNKSVSPA